MFELNLVISLLLFGDLSPDLYLTWIFYIKKAVLYFNQEGVKSNRIYSGITESDQYKINQNDYIVAKQYFCTDESDLFQNDNIPIYRPCSVMI